MSEFQDSVKKFAKYVLAPINIEFFTILDISEYAEVTLPRSFLSLNIGERRIATIHPGKGTNELEILIYDEAMILHFKRAVIKSKMKVKLDSTTHDIHTGLPLH